MESTGATATNATAATDGIKHDAAAYDATESYADTNSEDTETATDGHKHDAYSEDAIWSTVAPTTVEYDLTVRGE